MFQEERLSTQHEENYVLKFLASFQLNESRYYLFKIILKVLKLLEVDIICGTCNISWECYGFGILIVLRFMRIGFVETFIIILWQIFSLSTFRHTSFAGSGIVMIQSQIGNLVSDIIIYLPEETMCLLSLLSQKRPVINTKY